MCVLKFEKVIKKNLGNETFRPIFFDKKDLDKRFCPKFDFGQIGVDMLKNGGAERRLQQGLRVFARTYCYWLEINRH